MEKTSLLGWRKQASLQLWRFDRTRLEGLEASLISNHPAVIPSDPRAGRMGPQGQEVVVATNWMV